MKAAGDRSGQVATRGRVGAGGAPDDCGLMPGEHRPLVGCTLGDPAGIGPDVLLRAACEDTGADLLLLGDPDHLRSRLRALAATEGLLAAPLSDLSTVTDPTQARKHQRNGQRGPWVLPCTTVVPGLQLGTPRNEDARAAIESIQAGAELALSGGIDALVTAPVNKHQIAALETRFMGHTEYLAAHAGVRHPIMLFAGPTPHIALLTTHLPLATALTLVRHELVATMLKRLHRQWSQRFGRAPVIGVAAFNPHAGEGGRLGTEESRELSPAIQAAREAGVDAQGPYPADSIFLRRGLDVVLALYHDQGTIMAKRAPWPTINLTLGLPYVRTSPDHGTAYDLAGTGRADHAPMVAAIRLAAELCAVRGGGVPPSAAPTGVSG